MTIPFYKLSATGNDFVVIDHRKPFLRPDRFVEFVTTVCTPHTGVGADGILLLEASAGATWQMVYYNADGSRGEMCGNGARALAQFAAYQHLWEQHATFTADDGIHEIRRDGNRLGVTLNVSPEYSSVTLSDDRQGWFLNTGVPHLVLFSSDVDSEEVLESGRTYRFAEQFQPDGTNVNFAQLRDDHILLRTYERGVEGETLACGTGATATAIVAIDTGNLDSPVTVRTAGGEMIIRREGEQWWLWGRVQEIFRGDLLLGNTIDRYIASEQSISKGK